MVLLSDRVVGLKLQNVVVNQGFSQEEAPQAVLTLTTFAELLQKILGWLMELPFVYTAASKLIIKRGSSPTFLPNNNQQQLCRCVMPFVQPKHNKKTWLKQNMACFVNRFLIPKHLPILWYYTHPQKKLTHFFPFVASLTFASFLSSQAKLRIQQ